LIPSAESYLGFGYEFDSKSTPRLAAVNLGNEFFLGFISKDILMVNKFELKPGSGVYISTYGSSKFEFFQGVDFNDASKASILIKDFGPFSKMSDYVCSASITKQDGKLIVSVTN
jgi:IMP cyclohydrolase